MKALMANDGPRREGTTKAAPRTVAAPMEAAGARVARLELGNRPVSGHVSCGDRARNGDRCVFADDGTNELMEAIPVAAAVVVGARGPQFAGKLAAPVAAEWRAGGACAMDGPGRSLPFSGMRTAAGDCRPTRLGSGEGGRGYGRLAKPGGRMAEELARQEVGPR